MVKMLSPGGEPWGRPRERREPAGTSKRQRLVVVWVGRETGTEDIKPGTKDFKQGSSIRREEATFIPIDEQGRGLVMNELGLVTSSKIHPGRPPHPHLPGLQVSTFLGFEAPPPPPAAAGGDATRTSHRPSARTKNSWAPVSPYLHNVAAFR